MLKSLLMVVVLCGCGGAIEKERVLIVEVERARTSCGPDGVTRSGCDPIAGGRVDATGGKTDLAIDGLGYFALSSRGRHLVTRYGAFTVGPDSRIVNLDGYALQGFSKGATVAADLEARPTNQLAIPTSQISIAARLDPSGSIITFHPGDPLSSSNFNSSVTIYDSLGQAYDVTLYFNRSASGSWDFHALVPDGSVLTGGTAGVPAEIANGTLTFDTSGRLDTVTQTTTFNPLNAVNPQPLDFVLGDPLSAGGTGLLGIVQNAGGNRNETTFTGQDGAAAGTLSSVRVDREGRVLGSYSNGRDSELGRVALIRASPETLRHVGGALFEPMDDANLLVGAPTEGLFGSIRSGALERVCE